MWLAWRCRWRGIADGMDGVGAPSVSIAVVGKYTGLRDSYLSIDKALQHAAIATGQRLHTHYIEAQYLAPPPPGQEHTETDADRQRRVS
jgi:CTP synthase